MDAAFAPLAREDAVREGSPTLVEALDAFLDDLLLAGRSPATIETYKSLLKPLRAHESLTTPLCREQVANAMLHRSRATAHTLWAALGSFAKWHVQHGYLVRSPMIDIPCPTVPEKPHRFLSRDEVSRLWTACETDQERLIIRLLLTGLRAAELLSVRHADERGIVTVIGKGAKPRRVPLDAETVALLAICEVPSTHHVLARMLKRLAVRAKVPGVHPHLLRHTWASWSLLEGLDSQALQQLGGWSDAAQIRRYTKSVQEEAAINQARALDLVRKLLD